jgi:2-dehydro-3-deoxyglucarate aldolase/4-hydroxy-2-oxoheptanedioate aldolase
MTFVDKMRRGQVCLGTVITFNDPTITEALAPTLDFVWIDTEHNAFTMETVQAHLLATKGSDCTPIVRVRWNDPAIIKTVLDVGAAGVIVPFVHTADDVRKAVAACRYPPEGMRGFGPRRPRNYGRLESAEFCRTANAAMITIVQIEQIEAVHNIDEILAVPGLTGIVTGPFDLAGSMGHPGNPGHPEVQAALTMVIEKARRAGLFGGVSIGHQPDELAEWANKGAQWLAMGADYTLLVSATEAAAKATRERIAASQKTS